MSSANDGMNRRAWLIRALAGGALLVRRPAWAWAGQAPTKTRLIMLGTAGGPRPKIAASGPSQVVLADGVPYVIDCGDGVARQLALAGVPLPALRHIFVTHHHSDHNADYGNLILLAWAAGLRTPVDTWGPPPLQQMTRLFFQLNSYDIETRIADEGRVPLLPLVSVHEVARAGLVMQDDNVTVTAALVAHPPVTPALAYRFDAPDRSIVFSGDTAPSPSLARLAEGADVLVHEALYLPAVDRLVRDVPNASTLKTHIIQSHTSAEDCGRLAQTAGVKLLVLSHFVPTDDPEVTDQMWIDAARTHFRGAVVVAKDLMEI